MPTLLILGDDDDPSKVAQTLLAGGQWQRIDGGWLVTDEDRSKTSHRDRQKRYRDRKRVTRDASAPVTRDAAAEHSVGAFLGEDQSLPTPFGGREGVTDTPARDASDARNGDARNGAEAWKVPPLTDEDRELGRVEAQRIADELRGNK